MITNGHYLYWLNQCSGHLLGRMSKDKWRKTMTYFLAAVNNRWPDQYCHSRETNTRNY